MSFSFNHMRIRFSLFLFAQLPVILGYRMFTVFIRSDLYPNTKIVHIQSNAELIREFECISKELSVLDQEWSRRLSSIRRIEGLYLGSFELSSFCSQFKPVVDSLCIQLNDRRYVILKEIFHLLQVLADGLKRNFRTHAEKIIPKILRHLASNVCIVSKNANKCIQILIGNCFVFGMIPKFIEWGINNRNNIIRIKCIEYAHVLFCDENYFSENKRYLSNYENLILLCIADNLTSVREITRKLFLSFSHHQILKSQILFSSFNMNVQKAIQNDKLIKEKEKIENGKSFSTIENVTFISRYEKDSKDNALDEEILKSNNSFDLGLVGKDENGKEDKKNIMKNEKKKKEGNEEEKEEDNNEKKMKNEVESRNEKKKKKEEENKNEEKYENENMNSFIDNQMDASAESLSNEKKNKSIKKKEKYYHSYDGDNGNDSNGDDGNGGNDGNDDGNDDGNNDGNDGVNDSGAFTDLNDKMVADVNADVDMDADVEPEKDKWIAYEMERNYKEGNISKSENDSEFEINIDQDRHWLNSERCSTVNTVRHSPTVLRANSVQQRSKELVVNTIRQRSKELAVNAVQQRSKELTVNAVQQRSKELAVNAVQQRSKELVVNTIQQRSKELTMDIVQHSSNHFTQSSVRHNANQFTADSVQRSSNDFTLKAVHLPQIKTKIDSFTLLSNSVNGSRGSDWMDGQWVMEMNGLDSIDSMVVFQNLLDIALMVGCDWTTRVQAFACIRSQLSNGERGIEIISKNFSKIICLFSSHLNSTHPKVIKVALECLYEIFPYFRSSFEYDLDNILPKIYVRFVDTKPQVRLLAGSVLVKIWTLYARETLLPSLLKTLEPPYSLKTKTHTLDFGTSALSEHNVYIETVSSDRTLFNPFGDLSPKSIKRWIHQLFHLIKFEKDSNFKNAALRALIMAYSNLNSNIIIQKILNMPCMEQTSLRKELYQIFPQIESRIQKVTKNFKFNSNSFQRPFPITPFSVSSPRSLLLLEQQAMDKISFSSKSLQRDTYVNDNIIVVEKEGKGEYGGDAKDNGIHDWRKSMVDGCIDGTSKKDKKLFIDFPNMNDSFSFDFDSMELPLSHGTVNRVFLSSDENVEIMETKLEGKDEESILERSETKDSDVKLKFGDRDVKFGDPNIEFDDLELGRKEKEKEKEMELELEVKEEKEKKEKRMLKKYSCNYLPKLFKSRVRFKN